MKSIVITYCRPCGYLKRAQAAAAGLKGKYGLNATLVPGHGGIFEVSVGGEVVVKRTRSAFPDTETIVRVVGEKIE